MGSFFRLALPNMVITIFGNDHKMKIIIYDNFGLFEFIQLLLKEHPATFRRFWIHSQVFD